MNQRKAGTLLTYANIFISNTISLLYTPYMLQMMGQSEYGLYGTASSFISYLSVLNFGIGGAYMRFNAKCRAENDKEAEKRLNGMFLAVFSILAFLVLIGGMVCAFLAGQLVEETFTEQELAKLRIIIILLTINLAITFIFNVVTMALQAYEKYVFIRSVTLVAALLTPVINIIALNMGGRAIAISAISLTLSILSYMLYFAYARKAIKLQFAFKGFRKDVIKEIFIFSGYLFLNSITDQITNSTDSIILSAVKGTAAVAVYTVGANFKTYFQQFSLAVSGCFGPMLNLMVAQGSEIKALDDVFKKVGRIQFYVVSLIVIGYLSIGEKFVCLWAGEDYSDSFYIGMLLMLAAFIPAFQNVGVEIQKALNKHKARSIVYFFIALLNIVMTIPFSIWWSGIGAALATMISMLLGHGLFMNYYYGKVIGLDIVGFWKSIGSILPGYIAPCLVGILINRSGFIDSFADILLCAICIIIIFGISVWFISMNQYEKDLITSLLKKMKVFKER